MTKNFRIELIAPNDWENVPMAKHLLTHSLTHSLPVFGTKNALEKGKPTEATNSPLCTMTILDLAVLVLVHHDFQKDILSGASCWWTGSKAKPSHREHRTYR
jgi:hypothetical protein